LKLDVVVEDISACVKKLSVEVPAEAVRAEYEKAYDAYQQQVNVPGFRPGRVPRGVIKQRFGKGIDDRVIQQLAPHALEPLRFQAIVEVLAEFELKNYKGVKATKRVVRVSEEDVEQTLQTWRDHATRMRPVTDRISRKGDIVVVNMIGKYVDAPDIEDYKMENMPLELGAEGMHPAFEENLTGVSEGYVRTFRVAYPADGPTQTAGKILDFTVTVAALLEKDAPNLDDGFAQAYTQYKTLAELRDAARRLVHHNRLRDADAVVRSNLLGQILKEYDFEVPPSIARQQAIDNAQHLAEMLAAQGMPVEDIRNYNWEEHIRTDMQQVAPQVRATLVAMRIAQVEHLHASEKDVDAEITRMADAQGQPFAELKARLTKENALSTIESRLLYQKALDVIVQNAEITIEEVSPEQEAERVKTEATEIQAAQHS
jgi:trigger factor